MSIPLSDREVEALDSLSRRLAEPQVVASLNNVLDHADLLALLVVSLDGFINRSEVIGDALVDSFADLRTAAEATSNPLDGVDVRELVSSLMTMSSLLPKFTPTLTRTIDSGVIETVLDSGIATPIVIEQIARLAHGLVNGAQLAATEPIKVKGAVSLLKVLKDPDINRALSFFLSVLKSVGAEIQTEANATTN